MEIAHLADLQPRRIGILKPTAFGDVVQTIPLLPALRAKWPEARISWVISRPLAPLLSGHACLDELIPYDRRGGSRGWLRLLTALWNRRFDVVFDLQGLARTGLMTLASRARIRVGLETAREGSRHTCNLILPGTGREMPAHERYWRVAEALGFGKVPMRTDIAIPDADRSQVADWLSEVRGPIVALHPGARWETKCWPPEKFAAVADRAAEELGATVVLVGTGDDVERAAAVESHMHHRSCSLNLAGRTSIKQLACVLKSADVVLCNDSGPMHLAAGLGTPVCGVFTCTSPIRSGPPGSQHALIPTRLACGASYHKRCPHAGNEHLACFDELDAARVWRGLLGILTRQEAHRSPRVA